MRSEEEERALELAKEMARELPPAEAGELMEMIVIPAPALARLDRGEDPNDVGSAPSAGPRLPGKATWALLCCGVVAFLLAVVYDRAISTVVPPQALVDVAWYRGTMGGEPWDMSLQPGAKRSARTLDPWGRPYRLAYRAPSGGASWSQWHVYSLGADGRDDDEAGDDVVVFPKPPTGAIHAPFDLGLAAVFGDAVLGLLGFVFAWAGGAVHLLRTPKSARPRVETARALAALSLPALLGFVGLMVWGDDLMEALPETFVLPRSLVLLGSSAAILVVTFFAIKAVRK